MTSPDQSLQRLLDEAPFVRALARSLLADEADEVVQQTWLLALRHRGAVASPRAWLRRVAQNVAANLRRAKRRRHHHEGAAAQPDAVMSSAELMQHEEQRRLLVTAVDRLPEPLRAVLLLRYFDGLPPRRIAARLDLPVTTVWNHLRRGLQTLREQLDREHGSRRAWLLPLVPIAAGHGGLSAAGSMAATTGVAAWLQTLGAFWMTTKAKLAAVAVAVLLLVATAPLWLPADASPAPAGSGGPIAATAAAGAVPAATTVDDAAARRADGEAERARTADPATTGSAAAQLLVRARYRDGAPASDLTILVAAVGTWRPGDGRRQPVDADGLARFCDLPAGNYTVATTRGGGAQHVALRGGETVEIALELAAGLTVRGIVVDPDAAPVAGAEILLAHLGDFEREIETVAATDAAGRFELRDLSTAVFVAARAAGRAASAPQFVFGQPDSVSEVRLQLGAAAGTIEGVVVDPDGRPVANAAVRVGGGPCCGGVLPIGKERTEPLAAVARTDAHGLFRAVGLLPGPQPVEARAAELGSWRGSCEVLAAAATSLRIQLPPGAVVRGTAIGTGVGPAAGTVVTVGEPGDFLARGVTAGDDGAFALTGLIAGEVAIAARHDTLGRAAARLRTVAGAVTEWDPVLRRGTVLHGRAIDDDGAPVGSVQLELRSQEYEHREWSAFARTGADGTFEVANCPPGALNVSVRLSGAEPRVLQGVEPTAGELIVRLPRPAAATATVRGVIVGDDGRPRANVQVFARCLDTDEFSPVMATGPDGAFELGPLAPGRWRVTARAATGGDWRSATLALAAAGIDLGTVALPRPGDVRVRFGGERGGAQATLFDSEELPCGHFVADGGDLWCRDVAPGDYTVVVWGEGRAVAAQQLTVTSGATAAFDCGAGRGTAQAVTFECALDPLPDDVDVRIQRGDALVFRQGIPLFAGGATRRSYELSPGRYTLTVLSRARVLANADVEVGSVPGPELRLVLR